ncbi:hypothetical protein EJ110_NYTH55477 [Nymphaea thermarum]|nr:hypothetical protein EJ110_NYTH55477 [Nymphaea thermarum]
MGAALTINVVQSHAVSSSIVNKGMMFLDVTLKGMSIVAMEDSGAAHNFVSREEAERMTLKTVNSEAMPILGEAKGATVQIEGWAGVSNFSAVPLDDFKVICGIEFFKGQNAMMLPKFNTLTLTGADQSHTGTPTPSETSPSRRCLQCN